MQHARRQQWVEWCVAALVGAALLLASDLLVPPPAAPPDGHPARFAAMAQDPFAFTGDIPQRILWPLLAHVASWFGIGPVAFSQTCCAALLAVVFWFCRQRQASWIDAGLITAAVASSGAVGVYKPMACCSDPLNLLLLVLTVQFAARPFVFWGLVMTAAMSHEMVFFLAPWFLWVRRHRGGRLIVDGAALCGVFAVYASWRWLAVLLAPGGYDASYYAANNFWAPWLLPALWSLLVLVLLAEFGPLLVLAFAAGRRGGSDDAAPVGLVLYVAGVFAMTWYAYDVMRFAAYAFLPVVFGGLAWLRRGGPWRPGFVGLLLATIVTYSWQHPVPSQQGGAAFTQVANPMFLRAAPHVQKGRSVTFADAMAVQRDVLRDHGVVFAWTLAIAVALAAAGIATSRLLNRGPTGQGDAPP